MASVYEIMLKFHPDTLVDIFLKQYMHDYGEKKVKEIVITVRQSEKVQDHIRYLLLNEHAPTDMSIGSVLNTMSYFLFSKPETLCLGGLIFIITWKDVLVDTYEDVFEEAYEDESNKIATRICADYIARCSKMKFTKIDTCFTRFFDTIKNINQNS